jgi:hypothetical protein
MSAVAPPARFISAAKPVMRILRLPAGRFSTIANCRSEYSFFGEKANLGGHSDAIRSSTNQPNYFEPIPIRIEKIQ